LFLMGRSATQIFPALELGADARKREQLAGEGLGNTILEDWSWRDHSAPYRAESFSPSSQSTPAPAKQRR
jgi:hypothetical protein